MAGKIVKGTTDFVKAKAVKLTARGVTQILFFIVLNAKRNVNTKKNVKIISKFPERALNKNQGVDRRAKEAQNPTIGENSSLPRKYITKRVKNPKNAGENLVPSSFIPIMDWPAAISQNPKGGWSK